MTSSLPSSLWRRRHHHHHLPLHHHLVLHGTRHRDESERHLDFPHLRLGQHLLADVQRRREADLLPQEDAAGPGHLGAEHGRDEPVDEDAVHHGPLEGGGAGVERVQVERVGVARQGGKHLQVPGGEGPGEGGPLGDVEQTPEGRSCCQAEEAGFVQELPPNETHGFSPAADPDCFLSAPGGTETPEGNMREQLKTKTLKILNFKSSHQI